MGSPTLSTHPKGYHARMDDDDTNMHYPKGFISADDNTMIVKGNDSELYYMPAFQVVKKKITPAEIKALSTTPIEIVPAPGSDRVIWPISGMFWLDFNTTAYNSSDDLVFEFTDGTNTYKIYSSELSNSSSLIKMLHSDFSSYRENLAIRLTSASDPTDGDSDLFIWVRYYILEKW